MQTNFELAIENLNKAQRKAVESIEGPVMVIAGPGTGKTEILSLRIGNIRIQTDTPAYSILCLTYTDAGTIAMRKRLLQFIGPEAHTVPIFTFHGFCNMVIQENLDYFGGYRDLQSKSDLEGVLMFHELIDGFQKDHALKRYSGDVYYEQVRLKNLFDTMKQEHWTPERVLGAIDSHIKNEKDSDDYIYKRKVTKGGKVYVKGDFNEDLFNKNVVVKMAKLKAAVGEFDNYQAIMKKHERYDYHDMLLWVYEAFQENEDLLSDYRERYLYILVDEFQDTNGIQMDILDQLASYWSQPNVFVVGDDDQAIFRFQGANLENMKRLADKYVPEVIVLTNNYRSTQPILDRAMQMIDHNDERLTKKLPELNLSKQLVASRLSGDFPQPEVHSYPNQAQENAALIKMIIERHENPDQRLRDLAILYRKHRQVDELVKILETKGIPLNVKKKVDVLKEPLIRNIIDVLRYIQSESDGLRSEDQLLFRQMHFYFFEHQPADLAKLMLYCERNREEDGRRLHLRNVIAEKDIVVSLNLKNPESINNFSTNLDLLQKEIHSVSLQVFFEKVINRMGVLDYVLASNERSWLMQLLKTLFDFIKDETAKNPLMSLGELLEVLDTMYQNKIDLPVNRIVQVEDGVNFVTIHSAKGLEFEEVFIIGSTKDIWESSRGGSGSFALPSSLSPVQASVSDEDERRLFYVAMTRAEKRLVITYARSKDTGKVLEASKFLSELMEDSEMVIDSRSVAEEDVLIYYANLLREVEKKTPLIDGDLIDQVLQTFSMSVTALSKYLECPRAFYFENILRVPAAKAAHMGFGSAMHGALDRYMADRYQKGKEDYGIVDLLKIFKLEMLKERAQFSEKEFEDRTEFGIKLLTRYYEEYQSTWSDAPEYFFEYKIKDTEWKGVPIKGVLDKVIIWPNKVEVVDYKTGSYENAVKKLKGPSDKDVNGGDYWRQIVFYHMLVKADTRKNWKVDEGIIDFLVPTKVKDELKQVTVEVGPSDIDFVEQQLIEIYDKIKNKDFHSGCDECRWCELVSQNSA